MHLIFLLSKSHYIFVLKTPGQCRIRCSAESCVGQVWVRKHADHRRSELARDVSKEYIGQRVLRGLGGCGVETLLLQSANPRGHGGEQKVLGRYLICFGAQNFSTKVQCDLLTECELPTRRGHAR